MVMYLLWVELESFFEGLILNHLYIFTLTHNGVNLLTNLKNSLIPALHNINYTWLIKDNCSKDDTLEITSKWDNKNIKVIPYKDNCQNFSEGNNLLFNEAAPDDNDYILLLNNDVIFNDTHSIKTMIDMMNKDRDIGVVGSRLLYANTNRLQHAGVVFDNKIRAPRHFRLNEVSDHNAMQNRLFQVVTGAVLLTKAEYYKNCCTNDSGNKGMCERYIWAFDDVDFCLSIKYNLNKKILYCGQTNVYHEDSASLKKLPTNRLFLAHNLNILRSKWLSRVSLDSDIYERDSKFALYKR